MGYHTVSFTIGSAFIDESNSRVTISEKAAIMGQEVSGDAKSRSTQNDVNKSEFPNITFYCYFC